MNTTQKVLLNVSYTDDTKKFWQDSYIKNKIFTLIDGDIHKTIKNAVLKNDYMELCYNGKPQTNVYVDTKDGKTEAVGYIYRGKTDIDGKKALFDVWVTIKAISDYEIKELI